MRCPVQIDKRVPDDSSEPALQTSATAVCRKLRDALAIDELCPVQLNVYTVDNILSVNVGFCELSCKAFNVGAVLVIELPPGALVAFRTAERQKQVVGLKQVEKLGYFVLGDRLSRRTGEPSE